jgi:inhibitor of growth protein 3
MPVSRAQTHPVMPTPSNPLTSVNVPVAAVPAPSLTESTPAEGADGDEDGERYCVCNGPSYGEMIACDDRNCIHEWVRAELQIRFSC